MLMNKNNLKNKKLSDKIKYICSIPVKNEGRALNIIFVLCLICIIALFIYVFRSLNSIFDYLETSMKANSSLKIEDYINNRIYEYEHRNMISNDL